MTNNTKFSTKPAEINNMEISKAFSFTWHLRNLSNITSEICDENMTDDTNVGYTSTYYICVSYDL